MARIWSSGFELNSKTTGVEFDNFSTTPTSIVTSPVRTGTYSARVNPSATTAQIRKNLYAADQSIIGYMRIYIRVASIPSATTEIVRWINAAGSTNVARLALTTDNKLQLKTSGSVQVGSDSLALNLNQWYRIEMKVDATTNPGNLELRLDGSRVAAGANGVQGSWARIDIGAASTTTCDLYFDDMAVNDTSGSFQNSWPGPGGIIHLRPDAAGDGNTFSVQVGGSAGAANNYTRVNEVTPDNSTSYNGSATLNQEDLLNCASSGIGASDRVNVVAMGVTYTNNTADATSAITLELEKTGSGTKATSSPLIPNSTSWLTNASASPFLYPLTTYRDPDSSNWTKSTLDTMQIGYKLTAAGANQVRVTTVWALVDYSAGDGKAPPGCMNFFL